MTIYATVDGANVSFEGLDQPGVSAMLTARSAVFELLDEATFNARVATAKQAAIDAATAAAPALAIEKARTDSLDAAIGADAVIAQLKVMDNASFNAWWTANVTNLAQANSVLKVLARVMLRKVL
jgi:hypothetical protein